MHDHVVLMGIEAADELQCRHHVEFIAFAVFIEHAQVVEVDVRAQAAHVGRGGEHIVHVRLAPIRPENSGDVRAVVVARRCVVTVMRYADYFFDEFPVYLPASLKAVSQLGTEA